MRLLTSVVRLLLTSLGILIAVAIVLGRYGPRPTDHRQTEFPRYRPIREHQFQNVGTGLRLLDVETGTIESVRLSGTDRVDFGTCSPWRDGQGRSHVAGLWKRLVANQVQEMGLARYAFPGGEVLDRVVLDTVPGSSLCWFPGTSAKVLFSGWDGQLYSYSFDDPTTGQGSYGGGTKKAVPLVWRNPPPLKQRRLFWEPTWPTDPRLGGKVIVSLSFSELDRDSEGRTRTQLWWLQLNQDGTIIEDLGRLIEPETADSVVEERLANIAATPDGGLALAYLARRDENVKLRLRLAPVKIDAATGRPSVAEADVVELPGPQFATPPAFSADGRWIYSVPGEAQTTEGVQRYSVVAALTGRPGAVTKTEPAPTESSAVTAARVIRGPILRQPGPSMVSRGRLKKS